MFKHIPWTVPNILSTYRLLSAPIILVLIFLGYENVFISLFIFNQITDILDGYIARKYNLTSPIGALLDSWADTGSYILAIAGISMFHRELFHHPYVYWVIGYLIIYSSTIAAAYFKFNKVSVGLHLYSSKINAYVQGVFLIVLFSIGLFPQFFYLCMVVGYLAEAECTMVLLLLKEPRQNVKGIYWLLKAKI